MADPLQDVTRGSPVRLRADTFNLYNMAARDALRRRGGENGPLNENAFAYVDPVTVMPDIKVNAHDVMGIDSTIFDPGSGNPGLEGFKSRIGYKVTTPVEDEHEGKFVVMLGPCLPGKLQQAMAFGIVQVKLSLEDEDHEFAEIGDGDKSQLVSVGSGSAKILTYDENSGWATVKLGAGPKGKEETESPTWSRKNSDKGVSFEVVTRVVWTGTVLKQYKRNVKADSLGMLFSVGAEVESTIDTAEPCEE